MDTYLYISALFLIVLLMLNFEFLLLPNPAVAGFGIAVLILGAAIMVIGGRRKRSLPSGTENADSGQRAEKLRRITVRRAVVAGAMYGFVGLGILILQAIGYFFS
jgi:hypothetical protein